LQSRAIERATALLVQIVGGVPGPVTEVCEPSSLPARRPIGLRRARIQRLLGIALPDDEIQDILARLGASLSSQDEGWEVVPPSWRFDLTLEADLIEEIGRVHGYDRLPNTRPKAPMVGMPVPEGRTDIAAWREVLVQRGYQEVVTYSFIEPELQRQVDPDNAPVALANPISSEMSVMRTSLWPGLLRAAQHNLNRQQLRPRLFEYGLNYLQQATELKQEYCIGGLVCGERFPEQWGADTGAADFFDLKADVEALLAATGAESEFAFEAARHPCLHPGQSARVLRQGEPIGWVGKLHPELSGQLELPEATLLFELATQPLALGRVARFQEISRFPAIRRDLAFTVAQETPSMALSAEIRGAAGGLLQDLVLFDVYQGKGIESGRKSLAFGLILQDSSRTLTEQDVDGVLVQVQTALNDKFGATLRE